MDASVNPNERYKILIPIEGPIDDNIVKATNCQYPLHLVLTTFVIIPISLNLSYNLTNSFYSR